MRIEPTAARDPYSVALVYNGSADREQMFAWLERGVEQRDPRMVFLQTQPKWKRFRYDARFTKIVRSVGLPIVGSQQYLPQKIGKGWSSLPEPDLSEA